MCSDAVELFEIEARKYKKDDSPDENNSTLARISRYVFFCSSKIQKASFIIDSIVPFSLCVQDADSVNINKYTSYYSMAIATLRSLISSPFLVHRRGKWYERLCIDLEHLNKRDQALAECKKALLDPAIEVISIFVRSNFNTVPIS